MNVVNLPELIREVRESVDFIIDLPKRLTSVIGDCRIAYFERKERVRLLKEIVEVREIGKCLQEAYIFKGDFLAWAKQVSDRTRDDEVKWVKEIFEEVSMCLDEIRSIIHETSLSNTSVATDAGMKLAKYARVYKLLASIPDDDLLSSGQISEICACVEKMQAEGRELVSRLDEHRKLLDSSFGNHCE